MTGSGNLAKPKLWTHIFRWLKRIGIVLVVLIVCVTLFGAGYEYVVRRNAQVTYPPPGEMVDIGGRKMHLDCRGSGSPTVILEAGLDSNGSLSWDKVQDEIARVTRTCSYDRAGVMWSDPKSEPQDADAVVADLHATLGGAGITGPLVLVGHSLGGPYIMNYTRKHGEDVKGLVFVDGSHPDQLERLPAAVIDVVRVTFIYKALAALAWTGIFQIVPDPELPGMPDRIKPIVQAHRGETFGANIKEMSGIENTFRQSGALRTLGDRPLVVLVGVQPLPKEQLAAMNLTAEDGEELQAVWREMSTDAATWSTRSRLQLIPDSMHYIQFQRPDLVIEAVTEVVNTVRAEITD